MNWENMMFNLQNPSIHSSKVQERLSSQVSAFEVNSFVVSYQLLILHSDIGIHVRTNCQPAHAWTISIWCQMVQKGFSANRELKCLLETFDQIWFMMTMTTIVIFATTHFQSPLSCHCIYSMTHFNSKRSHLVSISCERKCILLWNGWLLSRIV